MFSLPILSFLIFLPIISIIIILSVRGDKELVAKNVRYISVSTALVHLVLTINLWFSFGKVDSGYQFIESIPLIQATDFRYFIGIDGISLLFLTFTSLLFLIVFLFIKFPVDNVKVYAISFLFMLSGAVGTFVSLDLILFYIFYEASILPVFFIMGIFGEGNKIYSTFKFILYTILGSMFMIIAIIVMVGITKSSSMQVFSSFAFDYNVQLYLFAAIFIAFAVKTAIFPFHTWLPDTYDSSPLALNIILSGVLMKYGIYGIIRILIPIFPLAVVDVGMIIYILSALTMFYAGVIAFTQTNIKRLFAYFSISHVALIVAAIFSTNIYGIEGAIFQAISHSVYNAGFFLVIAFLKKRLNSNNVEHYSGLATSMPILSILFFIYALSSIGLPLSNSFIGEFLVLFGIFQNNRLIACLFVFTIIINAIVIIRLNRKMIFGDTNEYTKLFKDVTILEFSALVSIAVLSLLMGIYPDMFLDVIHSSVSNLIENFKNGIIIRNDI